MSAGRYDFTVEQRATFRSTLTYRGGDELPVDLTDCTAKLQVRIDYADSEVLLDLSTTTGEITLGGIAGTITLAVEASVMAELEVPSDVGLPPERVCFYDLLITYPDDSVERVLEGKFIIKRGVTS